MPRRSSVPRKPPLSEQEVLPAIRDFQLERELAIVRENDRLAELWNAGFKGEKLHTAVMMVHCGLPLREIKGTKLVVRKAKLGDDSRMRVTFSRTSDLVPLPFGADRTMLYFLTNKAFFNKTPSLRWEYANEYMRLFGIAESGYAYKFVQE